MLFVDDDDDFGIFQILRNEGWRVTDKRDIESFEDGDLQLANVVYVDIHGVGAAMDFSEEGLGLASAIKRRWPEKLVVIYSAQRKGDRFAPELNAVDHRIAKDSEPYEFIETMDRLAKQAFDPPAVVQRLSTVLVQAGVPLNGDDLDDKIRSLMKRKSWDLEKVARALSTTTQVAKGVIAILQQASS